MFLHLKRFLASLSQTGLRTTLIALISYIQDLTFDVRYGTETMKWVPLDNLSISSPNKPFGLRYQASKEVHLRRFFTTHSFPGDSVFVDIGSGEGRVLLIASDYGFKRVVGIEFAHEFYEIARRNLEIYRKKRKTETTPVEIIESDALDYDIRGDDNIFYFYSPFMAEILKKVVAKILQSVKTHPRNVSLVFYQPDYPELKEILSDFKQIRQFKSREAQILVFENRRQTE